MQSAWGEKIMISVRIEINRIEYRIEHKKKGQQWSELE